MGTGPYDTHVPHEDIQELGNFIKVGMTEEPAHPGDTGIILRSLSGVGLRIDVHGPEFKTGEGAPKKAYALLDEKNGPFGVQLD